MGGTTTISTVAPVAGNLRIQTAVYGSAIPLIYGTTRISGNLIWFGDFTAIPHTTVTESGGKGGGGVRQENTTYTYTAAVMMALGEGPLNTVVRAWAGKKMYGPAAATSVPVTWRETVTVPPGGVVTVAHAGAYLANVGVSDSRPDPYDNYSGT
jgi:hypothetical protein